MRRITFKRLFESYEVLADQHATPSKQGIAFAAEAIRSALLEVGCSRSGEKRIKRTNKKLNR